MIQIITHLKIEGSKFFWAVIHDATDVAYYIVMPLTEIVGNFT